MKRVTIAMLAVIASAAMVGGATPVAQAATADSVDVQAKLSREGILTVTETITVNDSVIEDVKTIKQSIPTYADVNGHRYKYEVTDIQVTGAGQSLTPTISDDAGATLVSFPSDAGPEFVLSYTVKGSTTTAADGKVDFSWVLVQGLNFDVSTVTGSVGVPPGAVNYSCSSGVVGALRSCSSFSGGTHGSTALEFTDTNRLAGQVVEVDITFPVGPVEVTEDVAPMWSLGRALTPGATQLGITVGLLLVGCLALFGLWRKNRVTGAKVSPAKIAQFVSDESGHVRFATDPSSRPAMVGTLIDSSVDPADILSTILDLAQRGHLRITELPRDPAYGIPDWTFTRMTVSDELKGYERELLDALTKTEVRVSALSSAIAVSIGAVQSSVYKEVIASGWLSRIPGKRSKWVFFSWIGLGAAIILSALLLAFTTFGLVGVALIGVALVGMAVAFQSPPVTAKGASVYAGLEGLASSLHSQDPSLIDPKSRYTEISKILPYAVILGSWDRWVDAMVAADTDDAPDSEALPWYHAPKDWHMSYLPGSLSAFITIVTGRLFARV